MQWAHVFLVLLSVMYGGTCIDVLNKSLWTNEGTEILRCYSQLRYTFKDVNSIFYEGFCIQKETAWQF